MQQASASERHDRQQDSDQQDWHQLDLALIEVYLCEGNHERPDYREVWGGDRRGAQSAITAFPSERPMTLLACRWSLLSARTTEASGLAAIGLKLRTGKIKLEQLTRRIIELMIFEKSKLLMISLINLTIV